MSARNTPTMTAKLLLAGFGLLLATLTAWYSYEKMAYICTVDAPDIEIFLQHGDQFIHSNQLYTRPLSDADFSFQYRPSASEFKFPPAAAAILYPLFSNGIDYLFIEISPGIKAINNHALVPFRLASLITISLSILMIIAWILREHGKTCTTFKKILAAILFFFIAATSEAAYSNLYYMSLEPFLLLALLCACMRLPQKPFVGGTLAGIIAGIKIYPCLLFIYPILQGNKRILFSMLVGGILSIFIGWILFGTSETYFYFMKILPILLHEDILNADYNLSPAKTLLWTGSSQLTSQHIFTAVQVVLLISLCGFVLRHRQNSTPQAPIFALILLAITVMLRNVWTSYHILLWPALMIACLSTIRTPTPWRIIGILFCFLALFVDQAWWGETQLLREIIQSGQDGIYQTWAAQSVTEHWLKTRIYTLPYCANILHTLIMCKLTVPFILATYVVADAWHCDNPTLEKFSTITEYST